MFFDAKKRWTEIQARKAEQAKQVADGELDLAKKCDLPFMKKNNTPDTNAEFRIEKSSLPGSRLAGASVLPGHVSQ